MTITLLSRLTWAREYLAGHCTGNEAAAHLQLSRCQLRRCCRRYQAEGTPGLQHCLHGRSSNHRTAPKFKRRVLALYARHFFDCGPAELIAARHGLTVHPEIRG
jgi:hypothetical protein